MVFQILLFYFNHEMLHASHDQALISINANLKINLIDNMWRSYPKMKNFDEGIKHWSSDLQVPTLNTKIRYLKLPISTLSLVLFRNINHEKKKKIWPDLVVLASVGHLSVFRCQDCGTPDKKLNLNLYNKAIFSYINIYISAIAGQTAGRKFSQFFFYNI